MAEEDEELESRTLHAFAAEEDEELESRTLFVVECLGSCTG